MKGRYCPWLTPGIKRLMNQRDIQLRKARRTNRESDWSDYKHRKNACTNAIRSARNRYHKELIIENVNDPRQFWKNIKEVITKNGNKIPSFVPFIKIIVLLTTTRFNRKVKQTYFVRSFLPWLIILNAKQSSFVISHGRN